VLGNLDPFLELFDDELEELELSKLFIKASASNNIFCAY